MQNGNEMGLVVVHWCTGAGADAAGAWVLDAWCFELGDDGGWVYFGSDWV